MKFLRSVYHFFLAFLGSVIYGNHSKEIFAIGVTGTKGKSTVIELLNSIFESAGETTALISSVRIKIGLQSYPNLTDNTMPGKFFLQKFFRDARLAGCRYAFVEVTSEGVVQHRHRFIDFDAALFLNLHPEHIEAHGSFERYREAKVRFFSDVARFSKKKRKLFFINQEDLNQGYFADAVEGRGEIYYFSREELLSKKLGRRKSALGRWLANDFQLENVSAAARLSEVFGISWDVIKRTLSSYQGLEGRFDVVKEKPFRVVVDYAHTPQSLIKIYQTLGNSNFQVTLLKRKLICVLGSAGGGRDKWKRPELGKIAAWYCREIILTNEDPYDEKPTEIIEQIAAGINLDYTDGSAVSGRVYKILDRKMAIEKAISLAKQGDTVVITGKGSEGWIHIENGKKIPWNEKKIVQEIISNLSRQRR